MVVLLSDEVDNRASQIHQPYRQEQVIGVDIYDVSEDYDEGWGEIGRDVSHELGSLLHNDNFSTDSVPLYQGTIMAVSGYTLGVCLFDFDFLASSVWHICFYLNIYKFCPTLPLNISLFFMN